MAMSGSALGDRIKAARIAAGYKRQRDLATALNVYEARVNEWECGRAEPKLSTVVEIAAACGVSTDYLLGVEAA